MSQAPKHIFVKKWTQKETILLLERLHLFISSGLSLDKTIETVALGYGRKQARQRASMERVLSEIQAGSSLSEALKDNIGLRNALVSLISHGEASGGLAKALFSAHALMEREDDLKKKVLSAMTYPVVIGLFAAGLTIGLMRGVMPQIIPMLKGLHVRLPPLTVAVMWVSESLMSYGIYLIVGLILIGFIGMFTYRKYVSIRRATHRLISIVPIIGSLARDYSLSVFLRSLGSLIESGVSVGRAYADVSETVSFFPLKVFLISKASGISHGLPIGSAFRGGRMPAHVAPLLSAGESSGTLGISIIRSAEILDRDIEHSLKRLTGLVEPVMMAGMGLVVGAIAVSIMMPIYDISKVLQH